jgi:hypothetical protein
MKTNLAIIGQGVVSPAGAGIKALLRGSPTETMVPLVSRPDRSWPVFKVNTKDRALERWQKEPRLRRASPITYFLVEAAEQALAGLGAAARARTGLVIAFSTGCLAYSRRLFESIVTQGQKSASPALFPETVFNSPVSHVAATLRLEGAAYALADDETAWIAALKTAWLWLEEERVEQVLVMGAEEFDSACLDAYQSARWLRPRSATARFIPSEGAAAVLVRKARASDPILLSQLSDGFIFRSKAQALAAGQRCLDDFDLHLPCYLSAQNNCLCEIQQTLLRDRPVFTVSNGSAYLGEANTASAAWNTIRAASLLNHQTERILLPIWGSNHQIGALELRTNNVSSD